MYHVRPHFSLAAPAYGTVSRQIYRELVWLNEANKFQHNIILGHTKMAFGKEGSLPGEICIGETNNEVEKWIDDEIIANKDAKIVFLSVAFCDFVGFPLDSNGNPEPSGKECQRLKTSDGDRNLLIIPAKKIISKIRKERKDIFLVAFKTTSGASEEEQYKLGLELLKKNSCNLVLANDIHNHRNMIVAPELAKYEVTTDRQRAIVSLVDISMHRAENSFTRTKIINGHLVNWEHPDVPGSLRTVVDWCVANGAYKPFNDVTVGHFGFKPEPGYMWSSRRKKNFNKPKDRDLVIVDFRNDKEQLAYGAKPSAGARSQYVVLSKFDTLNCIVHFHCPLKEGSPIGNLGIVRSQKYFECGSHQCGENTASGMQKINDNLAVVMLDKHGPNIVFSRDSNPADVISFISENFDLSRQTE